MAASVTPTAAPSPDLRALRIARGRITHGAFWQLARRLVLLSIGTHAFFLVLFAVLGVRVLALLNVGSVLLFVVAYLLLQRRINRPALLLCWTEFMTHATVASLWCGWNSGFHYYLLLLAPVVMIGGSRGRTPMLALLFAFYTALYFVGRQVGPLHALSPAVQGGLQVVNTAILFGVIGHGLGYYYGYLRASERQLFELATRDLLTGLFNRRHVVACAAQPAARAWRQRGPTAVLLADVDHFKRINDQHGHAAGDLILARIGQRLSELARSDDIVGRWGGEEFLLVLPNTTADQALALAERIRSTCAADSVPHGDDALRVTLSFGVVAWARDEPFDAAVARADRALYRSKALGRDRVTAG